MNRKHSSCNLFGIKAIRSIIATICVTGLMCGLSADGAQTNKKKIAEEAIASLDFKMGCFRIEKSLSPSFEINVKHFLWKRLVECKSRGDALGFLNAADDIVNGRSDPTTTYKALPDAGTIRAVCAGLKKTKFRCEFNSTGRKLAVLREDENWRHFIARCRNNDFRLDKETGKILYRKDRDYLPFVPVGFLIEVKAEEKFAVFGSEWVYIGERGSLDRYAQTDFRKKVDDSCKQVADQEISISEFKGKLMKMDSDIREKINTQLISMNQREIPEPAVRTKSDFEAKVMEVSFCVGDHIVVQEGLIPYIHTAIVDESLLKLHRYQQARAWEKMVEELVPNADLGSPDVYGVAWKALSERNFRVKILYTHSLYCITRYAKSTSSGDEEKGESEVYVNVVGKDPIFVYASENGKNPIENLVNRSDFDVAKWIKTHEFSGGKMPRAIERKGFRDRSLLLELKPQNAPYATPLPPNYKFSLDEIQCNAAMYSFYRLRKVIDEIKSPSCPVITNVVEKKDSRGKTVKEIERRAQPNLPQEIKRLAKIFSNPVFVEVYRKYGGEEKPENLMSDWKRASKVVGSPEPLRDDIKRRWGEAYRDRLSRQELKERYEVYDRRAKGEDFKPDQFNKWALEDQSFIVYKRYIDLLNSLTGYLYEIQKQRYQKIRRKK